MNHKFSWLLMAILSVAAFRANAAFTMPTEDGQPWQQLADETLLSQQPLLGAGQWQIDYLGSLAGYNNSLLYSIGSGQLTSLFDNNPRSDSIGDSRVATLNVNSSLNLFLNTDVNNAVFDNQYSADSVQAIWTQVGSSKNYRLYWEDTPLGSSDHDFNDFVVSVSAVPEPKTYALLFAGMALITVVTSRKRNSMPQQRLS